MGDGHAVLKVLCWMIPAKDLFQTSPFVYFVSLGQGDIHRKMRCFVWGRRWQKRVAVSNVNKLPLERSDPEHSKENSQSAEDDLLLMGGTNLVINCY